MACRARQTGGVAIMTRRGSGARCVASMCDLRLEPRDCFPRLHAQYRQPQGRQAQSRKSNDCAPPRTFEKWMRSRHQAAKRRVAVGVLKITNPAGCMHVEGQGPLESLDAVHEHNHYKYSAHEKLLLAIRSGTAAGARRADVGRSHAPSRGDATASQRPARLQISRTTSN